MDATQKGEVLSRSSAGLLDGIPGASAPPKRNRPAGTSRGHQGRGGPTSQVAWGDRNKAQADVGGSWLDPTAPRHQWRSDAAPSRRLSTGPADAPSFKTYFSNYGDYKGAGNFGGSAMRYRQTKNFLNNPAMFARRSAVVFIAAEVTRGLQEWSGMSNVSWDMDNDVAKARIKPIQPGLATIGQGVYQGVAATAGGMVESVGGLVAEIALTAAATQWDIMSALTGGDSTEGRAHAAKALDFQKHIYTWAKSGFLLESPMSWAEKREEQVLLEYNQKKQEAHRGVKSNFIKSMNRAIESNKDALSLRGVGTLDQIGSSALANDANKAALQRLQRAAAGDIDLDKVRKEVYNKNVYGHNERK